jgi:hypothetical protein
MKMDIELETYVEQIMDEQKTRNGISIGFFDLINDFVHGVSLVFQSRRR